MSQLKQEDDDSTKDQITNTEREDCNTSVMSPPEQFQPEAAHDDNDSQSQSSPYTVEKTSNPELVSKKPPHAGIPQFGSQPAEDNTRVEPGIAASDASQLDIDHLSAQVGPESTAQKPWQSTSNAIAQVLAQDPDPTALNLAVSLTSSTSSSRCASFAAPIADTADQDLHGQLEEDFSKDHAGEAADTSLPLSPELSPTSKIFHFLECGLRDSDKENDILMSNQTCPRCISLASSPTAIDPTHSPVDNNSTHGDQLDTHTTSPARASRLLILVPALPIPKYPCLKCELYEEDANIERLILGQTCPRCASFAKVPCPKCELYEQDRDIERLGRDQACPCCALYAPVAVAVNVVDGNGPWIRPMETGNWSRYGEWHDSD